MISGQFISNKNEKTVEYVHPRINGILYYNNKSLELPAGDGLVLFRKKFIFDGASAVIRATSLGIFDLFVNGRRVGSDELKPGWTDYYRRVFVFEYDITPLLCAGENVVSAAVSKGWWSGRISFGYYGFRRRAFACEVELTSRDGEKTLIPSDESWETAIGGRIRTADIWDGEYCDATLPDLALGLDDDSWESAELTDGDLPETVPAEGGAVCVRENLSRTPRSASLCRGIDNDGSDFGQVHVVTRRVGDGCEAFHIAAGESVIVDMGQNMVGRPAITIRAPRGCTVRGYVAEMLNDSGDTSRGNDGAKGSLYMKNYRSALARLVYVASGEGEESYRPTHTFYGFRYVEICADCDIDLLSLRGEVVGSEMREVGDIETSDPEINKLISNIKWGMRGNYLSVPTDCPQRDERLGWTGDTQIFCGAGTYFCDTYSFMRKWLHDARDSQIGFDGAYCDVIPRVFSDEKNNGNAAWADAGLVVPYKMWLMYGDTDIVEENYEAMESYMHYLEQFGLDGAKGRYGDWLCYDATDPAYIAVCYYAYDALLMERMSRILESRDPRYASRAEYYYTLGRKIIAHYKSKYFDSDGLTIKTQTACILPLAFDMLDGEDYDRTVELLRKKIEENNYTLSTGFVGTGLICQTLSKVGLSDLAYSLLLQTKDPSWLYSVRQGATTVWERWNSYTLERGFGNVSMNSFNHYAYGAVAEWMFADMAGIKPDENSPGFTHFILSPKPDLRTFVPEEQMHITSIRAHYDSCRGRIESAWEYEHGELVWRFAVPNGTSAKIVYPYERTSLNINGVDMSIAELGGFARDGETVFELTSGKYEIR